MFHSRAGMVHSFSIRFKTRNSNLRQAGIGSFEATGRDWVDLGDVVSATVKRTERLVRRHTIRIEIAPEMPLLCLDAVLMEQVFFNLLDNACKYAPPGTPIKVWAIKTAPSAGHRARRRLSAETP